MNTGKPDMEARPQAISLMSDILGFYALWHAACLRITQVLSFFGNNVHRRRLWQDCFGIHALP